jgi:hypothetical protein
MATSEIKIKFTVEDEQSLDQAIDKMVQLGKVTEKDAEIYKKTGSEFKKGITEELKAAGVSAKTFGDALKESATVTNAAYSSLKKTIEDNKASILNLKQASLDAANSAKKIGEEFGKNSTQYTDAKKKVDDINNSIKQASLNQQKLTAEFSKMQPAIEPAVTATKSLRAQLQEAKQAASEAAAQFGQGSQEFANAAKRAGELKAELGDLNQTLDALDPDAKGKAFNQLGTAAFGAFQIATGALQAFGVENEKVNKLAQQFQGLLNLTQGLSQLGQIGDALKNVSTVLGFTTQAQKAAQAATVATTVAIEGEAVAATTAATATKGLTAALVTSPLVIFAAAAAAVAGAIYLVDEANEEAMESSIRLQKKFADLAAAANTFDKKFEESQDKRVQSLQDQIDLAAAQGQSQDKIIALEIQKQQAIIQSNRAAIESGKGTLKADDERIKSNQRAIVETKRLEAELTTYLREEGIKRGEKAAEAEKKAREKVAAERKKAEADRLKAEKDEADRIAELKKQFEQELATQTKDIDEKANIQKLINAEKYFGKEKDLKLADIATELQSVEAKIELNKTFGLETTTEQQKLYAQLALLRKEYDATNAAGNKTALQSFLKDNEEIIEKSIELFQTLADEAIRISAERTEAQIEKEETEFEQSKTKFDELLKSKQISQEQYDNGIVALEKKKEEEIKKLQREQAIREKALAVFNASITGALAILNAFAAIPFNPAIIALTAATVVSQIALIAAAPLPKFAKGTLSVQGGRDGQDSVQAMVMPGEAIIPTRTNRKYKEAVRAIYHESVPADELAQFVTLNPQMRYALLMAAGEQFNSTIVNKPTNISTAQVMSNYISNSVRGGSSTVRGGSSSVDLSGLRSDVRNNKAVKIDNTKQLAQSIADALSSTNNARRKW